MNAPFTAELIVERYLHGVRIEQFLVRHFRNYTRARMQRLVRAGAVCIENETVDWTRRVCRGERVHVRLLEPPDKLIDAEPLPLRVVWEDPWLVAVDKPPGMVCHQVGDFQQGALTNALQHHLDAQTALPGLLRPGIVHRLDRWTSGLIVVAKEHLAHRNLSIEFQESRVSKRYVALVEGVVAEDRGEVDEPLGTLPGGGSILVTTAPNARQRRPARTRFEVLKRLPGCTVVRAEPLTGRLHQIRVHLAHLGHPVVNDEFYDAHGRIKRSRFDADWSADDERAAAKRSFGVPPGRHALHASSLTFTHPISGQRTTLTAPLEPDLAAIVARLEETASVQTRTRSSGSSGSSTGSA